jgi:16S rRNA processing protein RimM
VTEYFLIARVVSTEGNHGFLRIKSFAQSSERFKDLKKVYVEFWGDKKLFYIESVKIKKGEVFLKFINFDDNKSVETLLNRDVFVDSDDLIKLPKGSYFIHDIIGCKVIRNNEEFGKVIDVYSLDANDVYKIEMINGEEILIPAVLEFIEKVDVENKVLVIKGGEDIYENDED